MTPDETSSQLEEINAAKYSPLEILFILLLVTISGYFVVNAASAYHSAKYAEMAGSVGIALICLSGCFDPINFLWLCIPFTRNTIVKKRKMVKLHQAGLIAGLVFILAGVFLIPFLK